MKDTDKKTVTTEAEKTEDSELVTRIGNTTMRIGLHFNEKKKETVDDIFHRLVADKAKFDGVE